MEQNTKSIQSPFIVFIISLLLTIVLFYLGSKAEASGLGFIYLIAPCLIIVFISYALLISRMIASPIKNIQDSTILLIIPLLTVVIGFLIDNLQPIIGTAFGSKSYIISFVFSVVLIGVLFIAKILKK